MYNNFTNTEKFLSNIIADRVTNYFGFPMNFYGSLKDSVEEILAFIRINEYYGDQLSRLFNHDDMHSFYDMIETNKYYILLLLFMYYLLKNKIIWDAIDSILINIKNLALWAYWKDQYSEYFFGNTIKSIDYYKIHTLLNYLIDNNCFSTYYPSGFNVYTKKYNSYVRDMRPYRTITSLPVPEINKSFYFVDKKYNVSGYIYWESITQLETISKIVKIESNNGDKTSTVNEDVNIEVPVLHLNISKGDPQEYLNNICNFVIKGSETYYHSYYVDVGNTCLVKNIAVYAEKNIKTMMESKKKSYIDTFFHKDKNMLWNYIKNIHSNEETFIKYGQYPQISLCLYGPPGTGKSSFAYRVAMALGKHLAVVDLRKISCRQDLFNLFMKGVTVKDDANHLDRAGKIIHSNNDSQFLINPKNTVYVLDEFDIAVRYLNAKLELDTLKKKKQIDKLEKVKNKYTKAMFDFSNYSDNEFSEIDFDEDDSDEEVKKIKLKKQKKIEKMRLKEKQSEDTSELDKLIKADESNYSVTLEDLLQIFQGPIANNGSIIIATTNNYNEIKKICPRLFRDGRLKPIYFGYPTKDIINEISEYYFNEKIDESLLPDEIRIPPARIMMKVMEIMLNEDNINKFEIFKNMLMKEIENYKVPHEFDKFDNEDITLT